MKQISLLMLLLAISCSKPSSNTKNIPIASDNKDLEAISMEQSISIKDGINTADFTDLNLGNIYKNLPVKLSIQIKNSSAISEALNISFNGANLVFTNNCAATLSPRSKCSVELSVNANSLAVGTELVGLLNVNEETYAVSGQVVEPIINENIIVTNVNFNDMESRREKIVKTIISNKGDTVPLDIDQSELGSSFTISKNNCPASLVSRSSCSLEIKALSPTEGLKSGKLAINNRDLNIAATMVAYNPVLDIVPTPNSVSLGSLSFGSAIRKFSITYFNRSTLDLNNPNYGLPSGITVESSSCVASMKSRKSCIVNFSVNPSLLENSFNGPIKMRETDVKESLAFSLEASLGAPSLSVSFPQYTNVLNADASIVSNFADQIKVSNNSDCSDGSWVSLSSPLNVAIQNSNALNTKYFKAKKFNNESACVSASVTNTDGPTLTAELPQYTTSLSVSATLTTNVADQIKVSNSSDCSDGTYVAFASSIPVALLNTNSSNTKYFRAKKFIYESACVAANSIHTDAPTISASLPQYTTSLLVSATLSTNVADQVKVSNNADCSDGSYVSFASPMSVTLNNSNSLNTKYFRAKKFTFESSCVSASSIHDNINPVISYTNLETLELNRTGSSSPYSYSVLSTDSNNSAAFSYSLFNTKDCSSSSISSSSGMLSSGAGSVAITLPVREFRSVLVSTSDLAGNSTYQCSHYVTFGQPSNISVPLFASSSKIYENPKTFTGTVKDVFNNNLNTASLIVDSLVQSKTITTDASGNFSFTVSSSNSYSAADGVIINYIDGISEKIYVRSAIDPLKNASGSVKIIRRSCQELSLYDSLSSSGEITIDPDLETATVAEYSVYCDVTTGKDLETVTNTAIIGRERVSRSLKSIFGVERITVEAIAAATGESVTGGASVYKLNPNDPRIRMVGQWSMMSTTNGIYLASTANLTNYIEVYFYGTGINIGIIANTPRNFAASVDGSSEKIIANDNYASNIIAGRGEINQTVPVYSGLSLGWHYVKIRNNSATEEIPLYSIDILNERANVLTYNGGFMDLGQLQGITLPSSSTHNSGVSGTKGSRVIKYSKNNSITTVSTPVDSTTNYLTNADHTNEEVVATNNFRDFGIGRADDFTTMNGTTTTVRSYTLKDGTTTLTLVNGDIRATSPEAIGAGLSSSQHEFTFTFIGSGLDVQAIGASSTRVTTVTIDGVNRGTLAAVGATLNTIKIASGLPFGTHTVKLSVPGINGQNIPHQWVNLIIYQPKKPSVPLDAKIVADYNILSNYAIATSAGLETVSTGVIRKSITRESSIINGPSTSGTPWAISALNLSKISGFELTAQRHNSVLYFTFWGTGVEIRGDAVVGACSGVDVFLIKSNDTTTYYARSSDFPTATFATYGGWSFNSSIGRLNQGVSAAIGSGLSISNLPLGRYTLQIVMDHTNGSNQGIGRFSALDVISPIHNYKPSINP